jgi:superoxide reductase
MTNDKEFYYCEICGIVVEVLGGGSGTLVCCGQDMTLTSEAEARKMAAH